MHLNLPQWRTEFAVLQEARSRAQIVYCLIGDMYFLDCVTGPLVQASSIQPAIVAFILTKYYAAARIIGKLGVGEAFEAHEAGILNRHGW